MSTATNYNNDAFSYGDVDDDDDDYYYYSNSVDMTDHNIWHFILGFFWTLLFYSALTLYCCLYYYYSIRRRISSSSTLTSQKEILSLDLRLLIAAILSFVLGLLEEVVCSVWGMQVPWRTNNSDNPALTKFDMWNVGIHLNGIVAAVLLLVLIHVVRMCYQTTSSDGATVASNESSEHENDDDV